MDEYPAGARDPFSAPVSPSKAIVAAPRDLPPASIREEDPADQQIVLISEPVQKTIQRAGEISFTLARALVALFVTVTIIVCIVWFIGDLRAIPGVPVPAGVTDRAAFVHNEIFNAVLGFLANLVLVLVVVEVTTALIALVRERRTNVRPLLLVPIYILMRGILLLVGQLMITPIGGVQTNILIVTLSEMSAFALVGLMLSLALAALRKNDAPAPTSKE
jgi:hypothetical protein